MVGAPHPKHHHLLLELGRGGMGTVYLAVARGPGGFSKLKVVKRLRADLASDEQFLTMFLDEARLSARLNHPNVVQTNEVGFDGSIYFIEMEYLEGQSFDALGRRAAKAGGLPLEVSLFVLTQALAGLHYAHDLRDHSGPLRIVHRDVSPHNVFVTYDGAVKVLDFGIAKAADSSTDTTTGVVKGKATYMSPEQATRGKVDRRADIFAAGVMLWETLTRKRLWSVLSDFVIVLALQKGTPPRAISVEPGVPEELDAICARALAFKAEDRFATAAEMQLALEDEIAKRTVRVGSRSLASVMSDLFSDRRAAVQEEIDARLRELDGSEGGTTRASIDVPVLGQAKAYVETGTGPTRTKNLALPREDVTRASSPSAQRQRAAGEEELVSAVAEDRGRTKSALISNVPPAMPDRRRARRLAVAGASLVVGVGMAAALAVRMDRRAAQSRPVSRLDAASAVACVTAADCIAAGGAAAGAVCSERGLCIPSRGCATNAECIAAKGGKAAVCVREEGKCVELENEDCRVLAQPGDAANDETIWFGWLFPQRGPDFDEIGPIDTNVIDLARRDFVTSTGGLPARRSGDAPRPLAILACDDSRDAKRAAEHLVEVGVPAVIGFAHAREAIDLYTSTFRAHHTLLLETCQTNSLITQVPQTADSPRLVWRITENATQVAGPLAAFVSNWLEPNLAKKRAPGGTKLAVVRNDTNSSLSIANALVPLLRIDGKTVVSTSDSFLQIVVPSTAGDADFERAVSQLVSFAPHVIVYSLGSEFTDRIAPALEARWPKAIPQRSTYVLPGILLGESLYRFVGTSSDRRHRFFGVELPANTDANLQFVLRYNETFQPSITPGTAPGTVYDALYVLAYAASAAGNRRITGSSLAEAIPRLLPPGPRVMVGPSGIFDAVNTLSSGKNIDLVGAGTELDLDPATGESPSDFAIYCIKPNARGMAGDVVESGLKYDFKLQRLVGELSCP